MTHFFSRSVARIGSACALSLLLFPVAMAAQPAQRPAAVPTPVSIPPSAQAPLTEGEQAMASRVYVGTKACELGRSVQVEAMSDAPGFFRLTAAGQRYVMRPVETSTGAVRLEDKGQGAVWIQLANKSMLMNQRAGRRLADECANAEQRAAAAALKLNPLPHLLDVAQTPIR